MSDLRQMLVIDFCNLRNGGATAPARIQKFGYGVGARIVSAWIDCFGCGNFVFCNILFQ